MSPYISPERRRDLLPGSPAAQGPGELSYQVTRLLHRYMTHHGISYRVINDILGALEGSKLEFYDRVAKPYEKHKRILNGDVYTGAETNGGD